VPFYSPKVFEQDDSLLTVTVQKFFAIGFDALEGLLAHIMFNAAGVHFGGLLIHTQVHEKARKGLMAHENGFGDLPSLGGQRDFAAFVDVHELLFSQFFDGHMHGGAFKAERARDVYLTHDRVIAFQQENCFKVHFA